jgi:uncharacterized protein (DUF2141 family)
MTFRSNLAPTVRLPGTAVRTLLTCIAAALALAGSTAHAETPSPAPRSTAPPPRTGAISAEIGSLRSDRGTIFCSLYNSEDGFPMEGSKAFRRAETKPRGGRATCTFPGLPAGTYAIGLLHDENDNGKMDTNFVGLPKEGYGASNDAKATFGPPKFKDAKVELGGGGVLTLKINVRYLL